MNKLLQISLNASPQGGAFLRGKPGTGKTFAAESLARDLGAKVFFFQLFPGVREEDFLQKLIPDDSSPSGIKMIDGVLISAIKSANEGNLTFLILDEWDKSRPSADSFLLDFLQYGRVNWNGITYKVEDRSKLKVFITLNDEREISEPLLRRLPMIKFNFMPVSQVEKLLRERHGDNQLIKSCLRLYLNSINAGLDKPATLQELSQLIDAANQLGDTADWNELVYMFVTKSDDAHKRLVEYENDPYDYNDEDEDEFEFRSNPDNYSEFDESAEEEEEKNKKPRMPHVREFNKPLSSDEEIDITTTGGYVKATEDAYSKVAKDCDLEVDKLNDKYILSNGNIIFKNPLPFDNETFQIIPYQSEGEILLIGEGILLSDIKRLVSDDSWKVKNIENNLIVAKNGELTEFCYDKVAQRIEVILYLDSYHSCNSYYEIYKNLLQTPEINEEKKINLNNLSNAEVYQYCLNYIKGCESIPNFLSVYDRELRFYTDRKIGRFNYENKNIALKICEDIFSILEQIKDRDFVIAKEDAMYTGLEVTFDHIIFFNMIKLKDWYEKTTQETRKDIEDA